MRMSNRLTNDSPEPASPPVNPDSLPRTVDSNVNSINEPVFVGFDPGRDKCGLAVVGLDQTPYVHQVVSAEVAIATLQTFQQQFQVKGIILGDQTTSNEWKARLESALPSPPPIHRIDERYTSLEARDRYWHMYPPRGLTRLIPAGLRSVPRPVDDIVAILLVERYLKQAKGDSAPARH